MSSLPFFATAFASAFMINSLRNHWSSVTATTTQSPSSRIPPKTEDVLSLSALSELTRSDNINLQESAVRILLDRAMSEPYISDIVAACKDTANLSIRQQALATIQQLTKEEVNRKILCKLGILRILVTALASVEDETTQRYIVVALYRLVSNNDSRKVRVVKYGLLSYLIRFLYASPTHNNDSKYWSLLLVHQFSLTESLHRKMIDDDLITLLGTMSRLTFGNSQMQKLCLHSLVRLISSMENEEGAEQLIVLYNLKMIPLISCCLRNDDNVARKDFCELKGLLRVLLVLIGEDSCIPRIILRSLKCLGLNNELFQLEMIKTEVVKKTIPFLKSNDEEAQYWALSLLHDLISFSESHAEFLASKGLALLTALCVTGNPSVHVSLYIADILVYLCGSSHNHSQILKSDILSAIISFTRMDDFDVQYGGVALLLNLATISDAVVDEMSENGVLEMLVDLVLDSERDSIQIVASKTLTAIAPILRSQILHMAIAPLVSRILALTPIAISSIFPECFKEITEDDGKQDSPLAMSPPTGRTGVYISSSLSPDTKATEKVVSQSKGTKISPPPLDYVSCAKLIGSMDSLFIFLQSTVFDTISTEEWRDDGSVKHLVQRLELIMAGQLQNLVRGLLDVLVLPLLNEASIKASFAGQRSPISSPTFNGLIDREHEEAIVELKDELSVHSCGLLTTLFRYESLSRLLQEENVFTVLAALLRESRPDICAQSLTTLAHASQLPSVSISKLVKVPHIFSELMKNFVGALSYPLKFYTSVLVQILWDYTQKRGDSAYFFGRSYAMLNIEDKTGSVVVSPNRMEIRNDSWTFESIRANVCISPRSKRATYAYEVRLCSDGIIQVGFATDQCFFDPEAGTGVGDDGFSYAYDGNRLKKWHGIAPKNNSYGEEWSTGDTITVLFDAINGSISYMRNGIDLGVAFEGVNREFSWYPAISLASGQGCQVRFGDMIDTLEYMPLGSLPIAALVDPVDGLASRVRPGNFGSSLSREYDVIGEASGNIFSITTDDASEQLPLDDRGEAQRGSASPPLPSNLLASPEKLVAFVTSDPTSLVLGGSESAPSSLKSPVSEGSPSSTSLSIVDGITSPVRSSATSLLSEGNTSPTKSVLTSKVFEEDNAPLPKPAAPSSLPSNSEGATSPTKSIPSFGINIVTSLPSSTSTKSANSVASEHASEGETNSVDHSPKSTSVSPLSNFSLSFYYEISVGLKGLELCKFPQIGLTDQNFTTFLMVYHHADGLCHFTVSKKDPTNESYYDHNLMKMIADAKPTPNILYSLQTYLEEGDTIGVGLSLDEHLIMFTRNGQALAAFQHSEIQDHLYFPCVRNVARIGYINVGQLGFDFHDADMYCDNFDAYFQQNF